MTATILAAGCVAACSVGPTLSTGSAQRASAASAARAAANDSYLYAADCCGVLNAGDVTVYPAGATKGVRRVIRGAHFPMALAMDSRDTLYVLNESAAGPEGIAVTEYDRGEKTPARRIGYFYWATTLALDRSDELYVANCNTCVYSGASHHADSERRDSIMIYAARSTTLLRTITQGVHQPSSLAFDSSGNLYVVNQKIKHKRGSVTVYAPASGSPSRTITLGLTDPQLATLDASDDLFVTNEGRQVLEYASGSDEPARTIGTGIATPDALTTDASGTLYVANPNWFDSEVQWISVYPAGSSSPNYEIKEGIDAPVALALDRNQNLFVANIGGKYGKITVYPAGARKPSLVIPSGPYGEPRALTFGRH
jgi:sugar lactone lactonase YvrE